MTTIAYKDKTLAVDSGVFQNGTYVGTMVKYARLTDGSLVAGAGSASLMTAFMQSRTWAGAIEFQFGDQGSEAIVIAPDGTIYNVDSSGWCRIEAPFHSLGSGADIALGAMAVGASAFEAVNIACKFDLHTRGPVLRVTLGE